MLLAFSASAQAPRQAPPPQSASELELQAPLEMADEGVNPQTHIIEKPPSVWRAFFSLAFVLGIAGAGVWALRKWGIKRLPGSGGTRMKVEETLALGERRFISIIKVDEDRFVVATFPQGVSLLGRLDGSAEPGFDRELEQQMQAQAPIPVRDMEARLRGDQP
jgi:flagellar biogenesis protein FliO